MLCTIGQHSAVCTLQYCERNDAAKSSGANQHTKEGAGLNMCHPMSPPVCFIASRLTSQQYIVLNPVTTLLTVVQETDPRHLHRLWPLRQAAPTQSMICCLFSSASASLDAAKSNNCQEYTTGARMFMLCRCLKRKWAKVLF
jgi:hypothetical protein